MIFIQGQARDNRSEDPFLVDGVTVAPDDPLVADALRRSSDIRRSGSLWSGDRTQVARLRDWVSIEMWTEDADAGGRPAPLLATIPCASLMNEDLSETVSLLVAHSSLIDRRVDPALLLRELDEWRKSPKAPGGLLVKLHRLTLAFWRNLRERLSRFVVRLKGC